MRIAIPYEYGQVNQHFGRSREFIIFDLVGEEIKEQKIVPATGLQHNHEGLAQLFKNNGVNVIILGGVGPRAIQTLEQYGLKVITGISGDVREVARSFARGELISRGAICDHHADDHHCEH